MKGMLLRIERHYTVCVQGLASCSLQQEFGHRYMLNFAPTRCTVQNEYFSVATSL
jgi:hypothetical protein